MTSSSSNTIKGFLRAANDWFLRTPERALNEAYDAALAIKSIEDTHFGGNRISVQHGNYSKSVQGYFQSELTKYLNIAKVRLAEFRASSSIVRGSNRQVTEVQMEETTSEAYTINVIDRPAVILKKLKYIDDVIAKYSQPEDRTSSSLVVLQEPPSLAISNSTNGKAPGQNTSGVKRESTRLRATTSAEDLESFADKTGVLPRSILKTVDRIKRELDPKAEEEVVENFRNSKARTVVALRFVLLLIIVPLLTQQVAKNFLVGPVVDHIRSNQESAAFLNVNMEEEALTELQRFEERMRFETLIGLSQANEEEIVAEVREKAIELQQEFHKRSNDAVKNVFADIISVFVFVTILLNRRREIEVLKSFIDEMVYGLSDSAKAFIIILFTDVFVGFHSPHGWEVLLEGISRHLGLPENRDFIFLFIATFPVILDTIFKYWIFRYLNRISPSAVATYRNMNE